VQHPALDEPVDLFALEDCSWNDEEYDEPPYGGRATNDSLECIVKTVSQRTHKG
jgi:hypothetical protein